MKRRLFIGSSKKSQSVADSIKKGIDASCLDWLEVQVWADSDVFEMGRGTLESLVKASHEFDYGVFVAAKDDVVFKKRVLRWTARDNVLFEIGLFIGSLGLNRAFVVSTTSLPSDLNGVTTLRYRGKQLNGKTILKIVEALENSRQSFPLGHKQSSALAYGYYNNFLVPTLRDYLRNDTSFSLKVFIPNSTSELFDIIERHKTQSKSEEIPVQSRHIMKYPGDGDGLNLWDIPRCLRTLESFAGFYEQQTAVGRNINWENWLNRELMNFQDALKVLIESGQYAKNIEVLPMGF